MSPRGTDRVGALMADWTRAGVLFTVAPTRAAIDLESVIARTADLAPQNERLFVLAATWLAVRHYLVDARRLVKVVEGLDRHASAVAGALLTVAAVATTGTTALDAAIPHCRPLPRQEPLFEVMRDYPGLLAVVKRETLPIYRRWGFWHNDVELKNDAVRPVRWTLQHCPELRLRALLGSGLDAQIAGALAEEQRTVSELSALTGATYAATHAAASRLAGRGLLERPGDSAWPRRWRIAPALLRAATVAFERATVA